MSALLVVGLVSTAQAQSTWCYDFNFPVNGAEDWVTDVHGVQSGGEFTVGVGFTYTDNVDTAANPDIGWRGLYIRRTFSSTTLTRISMRYDYDKGSFGFDANLVAVLFQANGSNLRVVNYAAAPEGTDIFQEWTGTQAGINQLDVFIRTSRDTSIPYSYSGDTVVKAIRLEGTGTNPFGTDNCGVVVAEFSYDPTTGNAPLTVQFTNESTGTITDYLWDFFDGSEPSTLENPEHTFEEPGTYPVMLIVTGPDGEDSVVHDVIVTDGGGAPLGELTRPLAPEDEHPQWGLFDFDFVTTLNPNVTSSSPYSVYAYSNNVGANVSAATNGTVIAVTPISPGQNVNCTQATPGLYWCTVLIPLEISQETFGELYSLEMIGIYRVDVRSETDPDVVISYYVTKPTVQVGDLVVAGCVLGTVIQLKNLGPLALTAIGIGAGLSADTGGIGGSIRIDGTLEVRSLLVEAGVTILIAQDEGEPVSLFPSLTTPPDESNCKDERLSGCMNVDSDLKRLDNYLYDPDVTLLPGGGVRIPQDNRIYQDGIQVLSGTTYTLTIQARDALLGDDEAAVVRLSVEDQFEDFELSEDGQWNNYSFSATGLGSGVVEIQIANGDFSPVEVRYICFAPSTVSIEPGQCYFANHSFEADGASWTHTGVSFASGQAYMPHESDLQQSVTLFPTGESESHSYTLSAQVRLIATSAYTAQVGKSVVLNYRYDTEVWSELGTVDSALVTTSGLNVFDGTVNVDYPYAFEAEVEVSEETTAPFWFEVEVTDGDNYIRGLRIDHFCLTPSTDDGSFPGQPGGGGFVPPLIVGCSTVPFPLDGSVAAWTFYHWSQLKRFFTCDLMKLLNKWFQTFDQFRRILLNVARYWIALVHHVADWLTTLVWWLDGHFRNIAVGQVTTINQGDSGCHDLFCLISGIFNPQGTNIFDVLLAAVNGLLSIAGQVIGLLIALITQAANLLLTVLTAIVSIILQFISTILGMVRLVRDLLLILITAYNNATPIPIDGMPNCGLDPRSSGFCVFVWVADNTIFSGQGAAIIPLLVSIGYIHLILWVIGEVKRIVMEVGQSS